MKRIYIRNVTADKVNSYLKNIKIIFKTINMGYIKILYREFNKTVTLQQHATYEISNLMLHKKALILE